MPKASRKNYYAVSAGREGPKIYNSWDECKENTSRYPGAKYHGFLTYQDAQDWLAHQMSLSGHSKHSSSSDSEIEIVSMGPAPSRPKSERKRKAAPPPDDNSDVEIVEPPPPTSTNSDPRKIVLSPEQKKVLNKVKNGHSVFFTGSAGTGKSVLLREIIRHFHELRKNVAITASTGIAAVNIGGSTVHSWAGIGLGDDKPQHYSGKFRGQKKFANVLDRWKNVKALIIDEISMLDGALFDKLEFIARDTRFSEAPFGGIQLILSGDFCQLPPVPSKRDGNTIPSTFAFEAETWDQCIGPPIILKKVFRQKDQGFINMLNEMRFGMMSDSTINNFRALNRAVKYDDGVHPTQLFPLRRQVESANSIRLSQLAGDPQPYLAMDIPGTDANGKQVEPDAMNRLLDRLVVPKEIKLKVGAQVMLVKNLQQGHLVNGSVGVVTNFLTSRAALKNGISVARVESSQNVPFQPDPEPDEEEEDEARTSSKDRVWPVVRFTNGREMLCIPLEFTVNTSQGVMEARRDQIPLILAWALSIHKSQGQTLERVKVDLGEVFEKGQAYVALSRATNLNTLQVLNFDPSKVAAHPRVIEWYQSHITGVAPGPPPDSRYLDGDEF